MLFLKGSMQSLIHFLFREDNFAWSTSTNQTAYMYFRNSTAHFKTLLDYGDVHAQSPSIIISKVADATSYNAVADPGEWPGPLPLICRPKWAQRAGKNFLGDWAPPNLRVWMTRPPTYLKAWIRHCNALQMTIKIGADNDLPFFHHFLSVSCHPCELWRGCLSLQLSQGYLQAVSHRVSVKSHRKLLAVTSRKNISLSCTALK